MPHVEHFCMRDVRKLHAEYSRNETNAEAWAKKSKSKINPALTKYNYSIDIDGRSNIKLPTQIKRRVAVVPHRARKDLTVMSTIVITAPQEIVELGKDEIKRFMQASYDCMSNRYGADNVFKAYVHLDETTPHIHIPVLPVKDGRINRKGLWTKTELREFQRDLDDMCYEMYGKRKMILNGRTKGNYTVEELRERERQAEAIRKEMDNYANAQISDLKAREKAVAEKEAALAHLEQLLKAREDAVADLEAQYAHDTCVELVKAALSKAKDNADNKTEYTHIERPPEKPVQAQEAIKPVETVTTPKEQPEKPQTAAQGVETPSARDRMAAFMAQAQAADGKHVTPVVQKPQFSNTTKTASGAVKQTPKAPKTLHKKDVAEKRQKPDVMSPKDDKKGHSEKQPVQKQTTNTIRRRRASSFLEATLRDDRDIFAKAADIERNSHSGHDSMDFDY